MSFFPTNQPIFSKKPDPNTIQDCQGLWRIRWKIGGRSLFKQFYTRIDQSMMVWALVTATIFFTAQFFPISWTTQAIAWSILTLAATAMMCYLSWFWVTVEEVRWTVYWWVFLMVGGTILTDASIAYGWGEILIRLCPLWLALCGLGYVGTGSALRSRSTLLAAGFHFLGIAILPAFSGWEYLVTGLIMTGTLVLFCERRWDMRPHRDFKAIAPDYQEVKRDRRLRDDSVYAGQLRHLSTAKQN